jgi:predicted dehydrogenase
MSDQKKIRWGIVSTGRIAQQFCQDMLFVTNGELAAVAARKLEDAEEFANEHGIAKAYQGYQALFDDPDIDVVYIATPHSFHYQNAHDALMAGKSVLCEKPITISSKESKKLSVLAKSQGLFLMEAMWTYFLPPIQQAKQWVNEGRIGKVKHIKADFGYPMPYDSESREYKAEFAGGCLMDMGIYPLAIANRFVNTPMSDMLVKSHLAPNGVDDDVIILADAGDIKLTLATSFQCKLQNWAYIIGEEGYITIPNFWRADQCTLYKLDDEIEHYSDDRKSVGFNYEAYAVGQAIQEGLLEHPIMPHDTSHLLQKQMEDIKQHF